MTEGERRESGQWGPSARRDEERLEVRGKQVCDAKLVRLLSQMTTDPSRHAKQQQRTNNKQQRTTNNNNKEQQACMQNAFEVRYVDAL